MVNIPKLVIIIGLLVFLILPVSGTNWTISDNIITAPTIDVVNASHMEWLYYVMVTNQSNPWEFPIVSFAGGIMGIFTDSFGTLGGGGLGGTVYLILWGIFILMVWRQSGKITMPALIGVITAGAWGLLFPESCQPWVLILLAAAIASQLFTFIAKE